MSGEHLDSALRLMGKIIAVENDGEHIGPFLAAAVEHPEFINDADLAELLRLLMAEARKRVRAGADDLIVEALAGFEKLPPLTTPTPNGDPDG